MGGHFTSIAGTCENAASLSIDVYGGNGGNGQNGGDGTKKKIDKNIIFTLVSN